MQKVPLSCTYIVPGDPITAGKVRLSGAHMYDPQKQFKRATCIAIESQHPVEQGLFSGPLLLEVTFFIELPRRKLQPYHQPLHPHFVRPRLGDFIKYLEDCCSSLIFQDDCLIASVTARKCWDSVARTEFTITEMKR